MQRAFIVALALVTSLALAACSDDNGGTTDTGPGGDVTVTEQGVADGPLTDGPLTDGPVTVTDTGPQPDQPHEQGGPNPDKGPLQPDAAVLKACPAFPAGCTLNLYVDARNDANLRKVDWQTGSYKPKCLWIKPNQSVTFTGVSLHPITQFCGPEVSFTGGLGNNRTYKFVKLGEYGYEWPPGGTNLFRGAIKVGL